jgi:hypothetical protein
VAVSDPSLPDQPSLYEPKYPGGVSGVWSSKIAELRQSPLMSLPAQLAPNWGDSHGCPVWRINLDLGRWNFGERQVGLPCFVWSFIRTVMIIGALFLARALIFGG